MAESEWKKRKLNVIGGKGITEAGTRRHAPQDALSEEGGGN